MNSNFAFLMNPTKNKEEDGDRYKSFKKILNNFISGNKDQNQYEDDCRALFGIQAYILFTLDRVVSQLSKQLQSLLAEEGSSKLLAMYTLNCNNQDEQLYHSNCVKLLEDERCFRFELEKFPNCGLLTIQLLDSLHNPPMYVDFGSPEKIEKWAQYVESYVGSEESPLDNKNHHVFLHRNLKKTKQRGNSMQNIETGNGLECRICVTTFRLFYVEHTEDYLYRPGKIIKSKKQTDKRFQYQQQQQKHLVDVLQKKFGMAVATESPFV